MGQDSKSRQENDLPRRISLCPACEEDEPFLFRLFCTAREMDFALLEEKERESLLKMQYAAKQRHLESLAGAERMIVLLDGRAIGSLIIILRHQELQLADIALLPEHRGRGIGSILMEGLGREEGGERLAVSLHVYRQSRAVGFYRKLGFSAVEDDGAYLRMEKPPRNSRGVRGLQSG